MAFGIVLAVIVVLVLALVYALAKEPGPTPTDVAIGYELAWDRLDFATLWTLSGSELRDGLSKADFVAVKRRAYSQQQGLRRLAGDIHVDEAVVEPAAALVVTRLVLRNGSVVHNEVRLAPRSGDWKVIGYSLRAAPANAS